ncbi:MULTISPECIES: hypothetical protein [Deinococcus]|uniref:Uncharacterized protein n=1 Tax=Deinococcus rufus TaxID=2136097 RepID=A0ABV7ZB22_9DEIO|nr:hypothetical protein [Deinococcus sp. AB2017081]WQE97465.1 hypothetical protein U2P90_20125 [Deinococcus sp. AB2017081]WQE97489.1 hypothetical protein U2P90_20000 [Deinococcus sp. AB2017081]
MSLAYAREKFSVARYTLASGTGRIQERLRDAWVYSLINVMPERDLPQKHLRAEFEQHAARITSGIPVGQEGTIAAYINTLSDEEAQEEAVWILSFIHQIADDGDEEN